jgi:hypothetical protein
VVVSLVDYLEAKKSKPYSVLKRDDKAMAGFAFQGKMTYVDDAIDNFSQNILNCIVHFLSVIRRAKKDF